MEELLGCQRVKGEISLLQAGVQAKLEEVQLRSIELMRSLLIGSGQSQSTVSKQAVTASDQVCRRY